MLFVSIIKDYADVFWGTTSAIEIAVNTSAAYEVFIENEFHIYMTLRECYKVSAIVQITTADYVRTYLWYEAMVEPTNNSMKLLLLTFRLQATFVRITYELQYKHTYQSAHISNIL